MEKQTAVEWFNQQIVDRQNGKGDSRSWDEIYKQALEIERQQKIIVPQQPKRWVDEWGNSDWRDTGEMGG
jgi:hypothetical protein